MSSVSRELIADWLIEALKKLGGSAHYIQCAKELWKAPGQEIRNDNQRFYTWQYDMRWAAQSLKKQGVLINSINSDLPKGHWGLAEEV